MIQWALVAVGIILFMVMIVPVQQSAMAGKNMIEYIGTSDWLNEVDKCVDLYQETEQNETLYYGCMNKLARDNVHYN
jgi:hypothetical protein